MRLHDLSGTILRPNRCRVKPKGPHSTFNNGCYNITHNLPNGTSAFPRNTLSCENFTTFEQNNAIDDERLSGSTVSPFDMSSFHKVETRHQHCSLLRSGDCHVFFV